MPRNKSNQHSKKYSFQEHSSIITLDPTQLAVNDAILLHQFLLFDEKSSKGFKIKVFEPNQYYRFNNKRIQFTHTLVRQTTYLPEIDHKEYSYTIYSESNLKGKGSFGWVYRVYGKLKHAFAENKVMYSGISPQEKQKRRVIKKQIPTDNTDKQYHDSINRMKKENKIAQLAMHTKTKKITFQKNDVGKKIASFMVMKTFSGKTLDKIINNLHLLTIKQRLQLSICLIQALDEQIHAVNIIHRDIKPENIFVNINTMEINIFDFGLSRIEEDGIACGTPFWISPETASTNITDKKSDIYSMGRILRMLWEDKIIQEENKLETNAMLTKRQKEYAYPGRARHVKLSRPIRHSLKQYLRLRSTDIIKRPKDFTGILNKMTSPIPDDRPSLQTVRQLFEAMQIQHYHTAAFKQAITIALDLKRQLIALKLNDTLPHTKLHLLLSLINIALQKIEDNKIVINVFIQALNIQAFTTCHTKEDIKSKTNEIINEMGQTVKKRDNLRLVILNEKKQLAAEELTSKKKELHRQLAKHVTLFKKKPIFALDNMCQLNEKFRHYTEQNIPQPFFSRHGKAIAIATAAAASASCVTGISIGLAFGVFGAIPTSGISLLLTPIVIAIFAGLGILIGTFVGFLTAIISSVISDCLSYQLTPHENLINEWDTQHMRYDNLTDAHELTTSPLITPPKNPHLSHSSGHPPLKHHSLFMATTAKQTNRQKNMIVSTSLLNPKKSFH